MHMNNAHKTVSLDLVKLKQESEFLEVLFIFFFRIINLYILFYLNLEIK
jgi:hypothetical protein